MVPVSCILLMMAALCVGWFGLYGSPPAGRLHFDGQRVFNACLTFACSW